MTPDSTDFPFCVLLRGMGAMAEDCREASATSLIIHDGVSVSKCGQLLALIVSLSSTLEWQLLSQENSKCLTLCGKQSLEGIPRKENSICKSQETFQ